jgi:hypothetical protein
MICLLPPEKVYNIAFAGEPDAAKDILSGREKLASHLRSSMLSWLYNPVASANTCEGGLECTEQRLAIFAAINLGNSTDFGDILGATKPLAPQLTRKLCESCRAGSLAGLPQRRAELWDKLPIFFNLPSWEELLKEIDTDD